MSDLFWLTDAQMAQLEPFFPKSHGKPRVDDRRVLSGIIFINRNGLRWRDAPADYGPHKTLYSRWKRWSEKGIFARMLLELAAQHGEQKTVMIDATHLKTHRTASSLAAEKGGRGRLIGRTKGGMNSQAACHHGRPGRPLDMFLTAGQRSDYIGARALLERPAAGQTLLADRGYDADWYREGLEDKGIRPASLAESSARSRPTRQASATNAATGSRTGSAGSRTGGGSQPATTGARRSSCPPSRSAAVVMFWL